MYRCNDVDDDCDLLRSRGQDLKNRLRHATRCVGHIEDPEAREAMVDLIEAFRVISEVLYDVCPAPESRLTALDLRELRSTMN